MSRISLLVLALAGCNQIFGLEAGHTADDASSDGTEPDSRVTGPTATVTWRHRLLVGSPARPFYATEADPVDMTIAAFTDETPEPQDVVGDRVTFSHAAGRYRVIRNEGGLAVELQSTHLDVKLDELTPMHAGATELVSGAAVTLVPGTATGDATVVYTAGTWTTTRLPDGQTHDVAAWSDLVPIDPATPRAAMRADAGDRFAVGTYRTSGTGGTGYAVLATYNESDLSFDGSHPSTLARPQTVPLATTRCVHQRNDHAASVAQFDPAAEGHAGFLPTGAPTSVEVAAVPLLDNHLSIGTRALASAGGTTAHDDLVMDFPVPDVFTTWNIEVQQVTRFSRFSHHPEQVADEEVERFAIVREVAGIADNSSGTCSGGETALVTPSIGVPRALVVADQPVDQDWVMGTPLLVVGTGPFVDVAWSLTGAKPAELYRVRLWEVLSPSRLVLVARYITDEPTLIVEASKLVPSHAYTFDIEAEAGFAHPELHDYTVRLPRHASAVVPFPVFRVGSG